MTSHLSLVELLERQQLLISQIPPRYNWIAQDATTNNVFAYRSKPDKKDDLEYMAIGGNCNKLASLAELAFDWDTPVDLSLYRKQETQDMKSEATVVQATPKGKGRPIIGLVMQDLTERALEGAKKYGEPLKAFNSRSAPVDALQEVYDLAMYLRQDVEERAVMADKLRRIADLIAGKFTEEATQLTELALVLDPLAETSECTNAS